MLFLDVDGVLNAVPPLPDVPVLEMEGFPISIPPGTRERVGRLLTVFEPIWASAWRDKAHPNFGPHLGISDSWPFIEFRMWKLLSIIEYANGRPWVWIDDDADWEVRELKAQGMLPTSLGGLVLCPEAKYGLQEMHVDQALSYIGKVSS